MSILGPMAFLWAVYKKSGCPFNFIVRVLPDDRKWEKKLCYSTGTGNEVITVKVEKLKLPWRFPGER